MLWTRKGWYTVWHVTILRRFLLGKSNEVFAWRCGSKEGRTICCLYYLLLLPTISFFPKHIPDLGSREESLTTFLISRKSDRGWDNIIDNGCTFRLSCQKLAAVSILFLAFLWKFWPSVKPVWPVIHSKGKQEWSCLKNEYEKLWTTVSLF